MAIEYPIREWIDHEAVTNLYQWAHKATDAINALRKDVDKLITQCTDNELTIAGMQERVKTLEDAGRLYYGPGVKAFSGQGYMAPTGRWICSMHGEIPADYIRRDCEGYYHDVEWQASPWVTTPCHFVTWHPAESASGRWICDNCKKDWGGSLARPQTGSPLPCFDDMGGCGEMAVTWHPEPDTAKGTELIEPITSQLGSDCDAGAMMGDPLELKPCPFCGASPIIVDVIDAEGFRVVCNHCGIRSKFYSSKDDLITAWNRRAADDEIARLSGERDDLLRDRDNYSQWHEENRNTINARNAEIATLKTENERLRGMFNTERDALERTIHDLKAENERILDIQNHEIAEWNEAARKMKADLAAALAENEDLRCREAGTSCANQEYKAEVEKLQAKNERLQKLAQNMAEASVDWERSERRYLADLKEARERIARVVEYAEAEKQYCHEHKHDASAMCRILAALKEDEK